MPMAKQNLNTVARLAMGTAILTVISGCETRIGRSVSDLVSPQAGAETATQTAIVAPTAPAAPAVYIPQQTVVAPEYVAPGIPTFTENSQAENLQNFEAVYGPPVVDAASGSLATNDIYTVPSYNDGAVISEPIAPPVAVAAPDVASYTQSISTAPTLTFPEPSYGVASVAADNLVYGESITTESYETVSLPTSATFADPLESTTIATTPLASTTVFVEEQAATTPTFGESYTYESALIPEVETAAPALEFESATLSPPIAEPITTLEPVSVSLPEQVLLPASAPTAEPIALSATPTAPLQAAPPPVAGGFEIISNNEAEAVFNNEAAFNSDAVSTPLEPSVFDTPEPAEPAGLGGQFRVLPPPMPVQETIAPLRSEAPSVGITEIEIAALPTFQIESQPIAQLVTTPPPRPKVSVVTTTLAAVEFSPRTAPTPRRRPTVADRSYATLTAPLPQPRPSYKKPVAMATSTGKYVSIGALPAQPDNATSKPADDIMSPADTTNDKVMPDTASNFDVASIRPRDAEVAPLKRPVNSTVTSELSGTSWRLVEIDAKPVSVNAELHFDGSSGFAGGQGPCNSYGGEFINIGKGRFSMADIFSTEIACSSLDVEKRYIDALETANMYKIAPGFSALTLIDASGIEVARFRAF